MRALKAAQRLKRGDLQPYALRSLTPTRSDEERFDQPYVYPFGPDEAPLLIEQRRFGPEARRQRRRQTRQRARPLS